MEASASFNYAEYCRSKRSDKAPSTAKAPSTVRAPSSIQPPSTIRVPATIRTSSTISAPSTIMAPSEAGTEATEDNDHVYTYVAMREPDPAKDAQPVAYAYYPQYAYAYPAQPAVYQKEEEEEHVRVRARVSTKSPKPAAAVPAPIPQPAMMYAQPANYAQPVGYAAYPYAYVMPNYPVPVHGTTSVKPTVAAAVGVVKEKGKPEKASRVWAGRTKKEVDEDNIKIAINEGIYNPNDIVPKDAKSDQLFWVIETDGTNTLRTFQTIDSGSLGQGVWKIDPRYGNAYFVRAREGKE